GVWDAITAIIEGAWNIIKQIFTAIGEHLAGQFRTAWVALKDWLLGLWQGIATAASTAWAGIADGIMAAFGGIVDNMTALWNGIVEAVKGAVNTVIGLINSLLNNWNSISFTVPSIKVPSIEFPEWMGGGTWGGQTLGGGTISVPQIPTIPLLAQGGIITRPTLAMVGEAGTEAVIPLDNLNGMMGGEQTIIVELDGQAILRAVAPRMIREARLKTGLIGL